MCVCGFRCALQVSTLQTKYTNMVDLVDQLRTCPYDAESLGRVVAALQKVVTEVDALGVANFEQWVDLTNTKVEDVLVGRLESMLRHWQNAFGSGSGGNAQRGRKSRAASVTDGQDGADAASASKAGAVVLGQLEAVHVVTLRRNVMSLTPPLQEVCAAGSRGRFVANLVGGPGAVQPAESCVFNAFVTCRPGVCEMGQ